MARKPSKAYKESSGAADAWYKAYDMARGSLGGGAVSRYNLGAYLDEVERTVKAKGSMHESLALQRIETAKSKLGGLMGSRPDAAGLDAAADIADCIGDALDVIKLI